MSVLPTVYIETTIPSILAARPSKDPIIAGQQAVTRQWWDDRRSAFRLFVSDFVLQEASKGNPEVAARRLQVLESIPELEVDGESMALAARILESGVIPPKAGTDAAHVALASRHNVDYLLTWNCRHIANAEIIKSLELIVAKAGLCAASLVHPIRTTRRSERCLTIR